MEMEKQHASTPCSPSQNGSSSFTPDVPPPENHSDSQPHGTSQPGTVIPDRVFVGGIDHRVNESELRHVFSQHGAVKEVKIVSGRSGVSKGYGFVTFENQDDALKILHDTNGIYCKDKKLNIRQAVHKQHTSGQTKRPPMAFPDSAVPVPIPCWTMYFTTSTGNPYIYHNGMAYFHCPNMNPPAHQWPPAPPVVLPQCQPVCQQPAYHHYQCPSDQYQWNAPQLPMASSPVLYSQPADGGSVLHPLPFVEGTTAKNQMCPLSRFHLRSKYCQCFRQQTHYYQPEAAETPELPHTSQPFM